MRELSCSGQVVTVAGFQVLLDIVEVVQQPLFSSRWVCPYDHAASASALSADEGVIVHKVVCGHLVKERGLPLRSGALRCLQQPEVCRRRLQIDDLLACRSQAIAQVPLSVGVRVRADANLDRAELEQKPIKG